MNVKQKTMRKSKMEKQALQIRDQLWPDVEDKELWDRTKDDGFTTMPRTMPYIINIIDSLTNTKPAGITYFTIWCRLFQAGIVRLPSEKKMSTEAGFSGERSVDTWRKRMKPLKDLGFIDYKPTSDHDYEWVLVYHPHQVIEKLKAEGKIQDGLYNSWKERAFEVGAIKTV